MKFRTHHARTLVSLSVIGALCLFVTPIWAQSSVTVSVPEDEVVSEALQTLPELPRQALQRFLRTELEHWFYTRVREETDTPDGNLKTVMDRHDPTLPGTDHWQLVSIDGREPTAEEIEEYNEKRADHSETSDEKAENNLIISMLVPDSVKFEDELDEQQRFTYQMRSPDGKRKRIFRALEGDMLIDTGQETPYIAQTRLWNKQPFRPVLGVRVDEVEMTFEFQPVGEFVLPHTVDVRYAGAFLMFKTLGSHMRFTLSDFRPGPALDLALQ